MEVRNRAFAEKERALEEKELGIVDLQHRIREPMIREYIGPMIRECNAGACRFALLKCLS